MASRKGWAAYLLVALIVGLGVLSPASSISAAGQAVHPLSQPASTSASVVSKTNHISRMAASTNTTSTDIVTNANDSGRGSLRDTIANASVGDTITFVPGLGTITLTSGAITLTHDLVIDGSAALFQVIHGNDTAIFVIPPGIRVMLTSLTIAKGGLYWPHLSAIINNGTLAVYHCNLVDNTAWGAIVNLGALIVENSYFGWNDGYGGGAISSWDSGPITVTNSIFSDNSAAEGGAIGVSGGASPAIYVTNSTFDRPCPKSTCVLTFSEWYPPG